MARLVGVCIISAVVFSAVGFRMDHKALLETMVNPDEEDGSVGGSSVKSSTSPVEEDLYSKLSQQALEDQNSRDEEENDYESASMKSVNESPAKSPTSTLDENPGDAESINQSPLTPAAGDGQDVDDAGSVVDSVEEWKSGTEKSVNESPVSSPPLDEELDDREQLEQSVVQSENPTDTESVNSSPVPPTPIAVEDNTTVTSESGEKGIKITIEGFPDEIHGVHRGGLNGVYYQDLEDNCVQGHPTFWQLPKKELVETDTPFIYFCGKNTTQNRIHNKWAISRKVDLPKIQGGNCQTFAPFPSKKDLAEGLSITHLYAGKDQDGNDYPGFKHGWSKEEDLVSKVKIAKIEPMDEAPRIDCSSQA